MLRNDKVSQEADSPEILGRSLIECLARANVLREYLESKCVENPAAYYPAFVTLCDVSDKIREAARHCGATGAYGWTDAGAEA